MTSTLVLVLMLASFAPSDGHPRQNADPVVTGIYSEGYAA